MLSREGRRNQGAAETPCFNRLRLNFIPFRTLRRRTGSAARVVRTFLVTARDFENAGPDRGSFSAAAGVPLHRALESEECSPNRPLVDWLNCNGFAMVRKPAKECIDGQGRRRGRRKMDIEIAVDAIELSPRVDHVVLPAGDGGIRSPMECLKCEGVRVSVVQVSVVSTIRSQPPTIADKLRRQADSFIKLDEMRDVIGCPPPMSVLPGPIDWFLEIGVPQEFPCEPLLRELHEHHLQTGRSGQLHHRKAVGVAGDQDDSVDGPISRVGSDVEAEPHVDPLLLEARLEVLVGQRG